MANEKLIPGANSVISLEHPQSLKKETADLRSKVGFEGQHESKTETITSTIKL